MTTYTREQLLQVASSASQLPDCHELVRAIWLDYVRAVEQLELERRRRLATDAAMRRLTTQLNPTDDEKTVVDVPLFLDALTVHPRHSRVR